MRNSVGLEKARILDSNDPLKSFREQFIIDDPSVIYLDGNSLGRLPISTADRLEKVIRVEWGKELIDSWNKNWYKKSEQIGNKISKLLGAREGEIIVSDNTSVNLFKLAAAALKYQDNRNVIVSDKLNFPSDLYILQGLANENNNTLELIDSEDEISVNNEKIKEALNEEVALLTLSHVVFKSAFMYDMKKVTRLTHEAGALVLWDLSHSAGAVSINLNEANVDLAVGCTYKYLNGGPGSPAFLYVKEELQEKLQSPIQGWFGSANPFSFSLQYQAETGIRKYLTGTPSVLSLAAIEHGVDITLKAGMENIRDKSWKMSQFFIELYHEELIDLGFKLTSPSLPEQRGSHLTLSHKEAFRMNKALMDRSIDGTKIIPDFRAPDHIRFGIAPLYCTFIEIVRTIQKLKLIVSDKLYLNYSFDQSSVT